MESSKIAALVEQLKAANDAYRSGKPFLSDREYDELEKTLLRLDPQNDWFKKGVQDATPKSRKVELPFPMMSLNKVKTMQELIAWAETFDILLNPSIEDAEILLNYMEGHDYAIGIDYEGKMYRQDISEENGEVEPYQIDDVIDTVCEWNYEMILDMEMHNEDYEVYNEYQRKYERLKADEKRLDRMFDKTCYAKEIDELATKLADTFIRNLKNKDDLQKTAENAADSIKSYRADKKEGR